MSSVMNVDPTQSYERCIVCGLICITSYTGVFHVSCIKCGTFSLSKLGEIAFRRQTLTLQQKSNISGYIFENQGLMITGENLKFLLEISTPTVSERAAKLLRLIARKQPRIGESIDLTAWETMARVLKAIANSSGPRLSGGAFAKFAEWFSWLSTTWSDNFDEMLYLLETCLSGDMKLIEIYRIENTIGARILPKGWTAVETAPHGIGEIGFVAMWFDDEVRRVWEEAVYPGIQDAGYRPLRLDQKQFNNSIDDEIMVSIRSAKFVVADFTGLRGGVYFEAGFALGLNKQVIWTIREDQQGDLHFDTRQFNYINWKAAELPAFRRALQLRIEATIGRGPLVPGV